MIDTTDTLILLSYYLVKSIFRICYPRPNWGRVLGPLFPCSYMIGTLSSTALKPASSSFPNNGDSPQLFPAELGQHIFLKG